MVVLWVVSALCLLAGFGSASPLEVINQWGFLEFDFPYDIDLINSYRPENTLFTGLEVTQDRLFLAMPRLRAGLPATVASIPRNTPPGSSPVLHAYPSWAYHTAGRDNTSCTGFTSVYRMRQDTCGRLWILDSGVMTSLDNFQRTCSPKLVIMDLRTDQPVRTVLFPAEVMRPASLFTNLVIDESQGSCDNAFVYITDTAAPGIVVYDSRKDRAWRFLHPTMFPDPDYATYNIQGETFTLPDGIVGLAHSPKLGLLYFQPLATDRLFSVSTAILRRGPIGEFDELPVNLVGRKSSQGLGLAVDPQDDTIIFSPLSETAIATWNPSSGGQGVLVYDPVRLQFPAEIRYAEHDNGNIWILSTRFQRFFKRKASGQEINLRIMRINRHPQNHQFNGFGFGNNTLF